MSEDDLVKTPIKIDKKKREKKKDKLFTDIREESCVAYLKGLFLRKPKNCNSFGIMNPLEDIFLIYSLK